MVEDDCIAELLLQQAAAQPARARACGGWVPAVSMLSHEHGAVSLHGFRSQHLWELKRRRTGEQIENIFRLVLSKQ